MKILLILTFVFVFIVTANGQEKKGTDFFQLTISTKKENLCVGNPVEIFAEITNISNSPGVIDVNGLEFLKSVSLLNSTKEDSVVGIIRGGYILTAPYTPDFIVLQPKETYKKKLNFEYTRDFFKENREYEIQTLYGQVIETKFNNIDVWNGMVKSNEVNILIEKCSQ